MGEHPKDLQFADKLCQWADIPFNPTEWIKLYENNKDNKTDNKNFQFCSFHHLTSIIVS